jgi:Sulfatase-modifying factor enzyme 1/NACHT domain
MTRPRLIPVLLYLRDVRGTISSEQPDLATLIEQQESIKKLNPQGWFKRNLDQGKCLVMLDGLDEVADESQRQKVSQWIDRQMQYYPKTPFLLTSRPFGYRSAPLAQVGTVLEVKPFSLREMKQFVHNWYLQNEIMSRLGKEDRGVRDNAARQAEDLIERIQNASTLAEMALNPLLLTMIATVHRFRGALPGRRVELYHEICDVLLGRRQDAKGMADNLTATQKKVVLQVLALGLMKQKTREFSPALGVQLIQEKLQDVGGSEANATQFLKQIENTTGLLVEREQGVYEFAHKSFQEYLAAVELTNPNQSEILNGKMQDAWWDETIRLYAAQTDASHLVEESLQEPTITALTLAYDCVEQGQSIRPEVRQELEDKLDKGLQSVDADLFKLAAEVKLSRRLKSLIRIDETTKIDNSLITCAEYQLFIDENRKKDNHLQPDHWRNYRFLAENSAKPIVGVRSSDAEEFCKWLTERDTTKHYRLPTIVETENHLISLQSTGYWCSLKDSKNIVGIEPQHWKNWSQIFQTAVKNDIEFNFARNSDLLREPNLDFNLDLPHILDLNFSPNIIRDLALELNIKLETLDTELACDLALELERNLSRDDTRDLDRSLARVLSLDRDRDRRNKWRVHIRPSLLILTLLLNFLLRIYLETEKRQNKIWVKKSNRKVNKIPRQKYFQQRDAVYAIYKFCVLVEERQIGNLPAWEGIRIVEEQILD